VKNRGSNRRVPVPALLIALGFMEYVAAKRATKSVKLFPELVARKIGETPTAEFSKWWRRYTEGLGVWRKREKVFHSFRGSFKDRCRESFVPKEVHDRITGHASGDEADNYGKGHSVRALAEHMKSITYPGVDLRALTMKAKRAA
jgi:integrase